MIDHETSYTDHKPNMIFSDRVDEVNLIEEITTDQNPDKPNILVFHGIGGQGKTRLCEKVRSHLKSQTDTYVGRCTLDDRAVFEPQDILFDLRRDLGDKSPIWFLAFDIGYVAYMQAAHPDRPLQSYSSWFGRNEDVIRDLIDSILAAPDTLKDWSLFPGSGLLFRAIKWLKDKGLAKQARVTRPHLNELLSLQGSDIKSGKILEYLPHLLADDIHYYLQSSPHKKIVLMVDEYERLWTLPNLHMRKPVHRVDKALQTLAWRLPEAFWVFFSRDHLHWKDLPALRSGLLKDQQCELLGLPAEDADELLRKEPIDSDEIRRVMIANATDPNTQRVHPLYLELDIKHYLHIRENEKRSPYPEDFRIHADNFTNRLHELFHRLMRDVGPDMQELLQPLAVAHHFNMEIFQTLFPNLGKMHASIKFSSLKQLNFIKKISDDEFRFEHIYRETIIKTLDKEVYRAAHQELFKYFDARVQTVSSQKISSEHRNAMVEALYHLSECDPANVVTWWRNRIRPFSQISDYGTILLTLERVIQIADTMESLSLLDRVGLRISLAYALGRQHLEREAEQEYRQILQTLEEDSQTSLDHKLFMVQALCGLSDLLIDHQDLREAETLIKQADNLLFSAGNIESDSAPSKQREKIMASLVRRCQGNWARARERFADADLFYRQFLKLAEEANGYWSYETFVARHDLGKNLMDLGRLSESETLLSSCLEFLRSSRGDNNRNTWVTIYSLAQALHKQGRFGAALIFVRLATDSATTMPSFTGHPWLSWGRELEAEILRDLGRLDEAEALYRKAIDEMEDGFGEAHRSVAVAKANLAVLLTRKHQFDEAEQLFYAALSSLGEQQNLLRASIGRIQNGHAKLMLVQNRYEEAAALLEQARINLEAIYGPDHFDVAHCLRDFAELAERLGDDKEKERVLQRIREINRASSFNVRLKYHHWQTVSEEERTELLQQICTAPLEVNDLGAVIVEKTDLSDIYSERAELVRYTFTGLFLELRRFALKYRDEFDVLDGTGRPIHLMNAKIALNLHQNQILRYLWFFCESLLGGAGHKFILCEHPNEIDWRNDVTTQQKVAVEKLLITPTVEKVTGEKEEDSSDKEAFLSRVSLVYADAFYHVIFRVWADGKVDMLEEEKQENNLPVATYMRGLPTSSS